MLNKRGYSFGAEYPIHYESRGVSGWVVFDARDDRDIATGLQEWEAMSLAQKENGHPGPNIESIDSTP